MEADIDAQTFNYIVCILQVCVSFTYTFYHMRRLISSFITTASLQGMLAGWLKKKNTSLRQVDLSLSTVDDQSLSLEVNSCQKSQRL